MNTPYLLICVEKPKVEYDDRSAKANPAWERWFSFVDELRQIPSPSAGILTPIENTWLIPAQSGLRYTSSFLALLGKKGMEHKVYFLEGKPELCS